MTVNILSCLKLTHASPVRVWSPMPFKAHHKSSQSLSQLFSSSVWKLFSRITPSGTTAPHMKKKTPNTKAAGASQWLACDRSSHTLPPVRAAAISSSVAESKLAARCMLWPARLSLVPQIWLSLERRMEGGAPESGAFASTIVSLSIDTFTPQANHVKQLQHQ